MKNFNFSLNRNNIKKVTIAVVGLLFLSQVVLFLIPPRYTPKYYYDLLSNQEKIIETTVLSEGDKKLLIMCKNDECFRSFYDDYTMRHGAEEAFSHLAKFQREFPEEGGGCHYISHGIGHAALRLNHNDIVKTFGIMSSSQYFKNIATCGNGYFHGAIEEYAKDARTKSSLVKLLKNVCVKEEPYCFHGIGHALAIQLDESEDPVAEALDVCDSLTSREDLGFECYSGVFMQQTSKDSVTVKDGIMNYLMCDAQQAKYRTACYLEQSSLYEWYSKNPDNYVRNIGFCKQISDPVNRMACIKLFAIRSVRMVKFENIAGMCKNTSNKEERVMCTAVTASKLGRSLDEKEKNYSYPHIVLDICSTLLSPVERLQCFELIFFNQKQLFYTSEKDLVSYMPSWQVYKIVYKLLLENFFMVY